MPPVQKGKSPFYPGQPVPIEFFVGRAAQIKRIMERGVGQVAAGKPVAVFVQGEYGIGKSSIANVVQTWAEKEYGLHGIYAPLAGAESLDEVGASILEATVRSGAFNIQRGETIRNWLAKYIGQQSLFGITLHTEALKQDAPSVARGPLPFLNQVHARLADSGVKGIFLILDEINGVTANPKFAHFIKGLVDTNALSKTPLPLLLMLCGVEERRREMIRHHQPVDRIFDVVEIAPLTKEEMAEFFTRAFASVHTRVDAEAMKILTDHSAGFPKIMHMIGDACFWLDQDNSISAAEAMNAVLNAAEEIGRKYVDQQVYAALRSEDYRSILAKIGRSGLDMAFRKADIVQSLTESEKGKFNNFLQKMKRLNVLRAGDVKGEYVFNVRMVGLYIWLKGLRTAQSTREMAEARAKALSESMTKSP